MSCIFCAIIKEPGKFNNVLYNDDKYIVLLDINPLSKGHILVIPKIHEEMIHNLPDEYLIGSSLLVKRVIKVLDIKKYNILNNNKHIQSIPHVHIHIIPYHDDTDDGLKIDWKVSDIGLKTKEDVLAAYKNTIKNNISQMNIQLEEEDLKNDIEEERDDKERSMCTGE
ncbi:hypothetical protein NEOKW01_0161 [Nematocida sp. AWRm80]|nr:hypothetical protein NEOKW01_0161 [Nematocida sp. AWRm80]